MALSCCYIYRYTSEFKMTLFLNLITFCTLQHLIIVVVSSVLFGAVNDRPVHIVDVVQK